MNTLSLQQMHPWWFLVASAAIALIPIIIGVMTSYLKVSIALGLLRNGFGAQQVPSGLVVMVLSLAITCVVMEPVLSEVYREAQKITIPSTQRAPAAALLAELDPVMVPWRKFLSRHAGVRETEALLSIRNEQQQSVPVSPGETTEMEEEGEPAMHILVLSFVLTELKEGLAVGFVLLLPFLAIDLVVANILAGLGMYMVSPMMISLPLKLLLFVMSDGWLIITRGLIYSYGF